MWLQTVEADRLRNLKAVSLDLPEGLTVVTGRNGQGKTTLLEAIYLLGTGRSFRTRRADELFGWAGGPLRVTGRLSRRSGTFRLAVLMDGDQRNLMVDDVSRELVSFIGTLDVVDLTAERMGVLRAGPEERRRFLDRGIVGLQPAYLRSIGEYRRVLRQRNALLRGSGTQGVDAGQLEVWDVRLVEAGVEIHTRRREYARQLAAELDEVVETLFPGDSKIEVLYRPSPDPEGPTGGSGFDVAFLDALHRGRKRESALGHTFHGPHRDDLLVTLNGVDLRKYGSSGQVRASMIALKLGKMNLVRRDRDEAPLFLMDDFDTDLDETRAAALAGFLSRGGFQALVATSKETMADNLGVPFMKIRMDDGVAREA